MPRENVDLYNQTITTENLPTEFAKLRQDFDAHIHDGVSSRSFEVLMAKNIVAQSLNLVSSASNNSLTWVDGVLTIHGTMTVDAGAIGGWNINATSIYTGTEDHSGYTANPGDITFYSNGSDASIHANKFYIAAGILNCIGAVIDGTSTIGGITGTQIGYVATSTADNVPTGLAYSTGGVSIGNDGSQSAYVVLTWNAVSSNTFDHYLIRYKKAALAYYTYIPANVNTITIEGLTPNVSYNFGVASVNKYGTVSAYSSDIAQTTAADSVAPATVTAGSATGGIQYVILEWTHNTDADLASYNIYRSETNDSGTAVLIGNSRTNYFVDGGRTGGTTYYYWVKAVDTSGNVSASFSIVKSAAPRNVGNTDVSDTAAIAASKILIDGTVYLSNWRHTSDITKIDGGNIYTGSVTTTQLNFTPVQSTNVVASINASEEGITINAENLTIDAATTFAPGYDPSEALSAANNAQSDATQALADAATAISDAATAQSTADGKVITFYQATAPTAEATGDLWIDTDDDRLYRWSGTEWIEIQDADIAQAIADAGAAQATADGKIVSFYADEAPTAEGVGDLWFDTNDNKKPYRWSGAAWVEVQDANKLDLLGGSYNSAASGARVRIFPDANTGIQVIDDEGADVFKCIVGGTDVGDVIIGDYAGSQGIKYDKSAGTTTFQGNISASTITGGTIQTATSGQRIVMSGATNYIQVYDADGVVGELGQGSNNQLLHLESPIGSDITIAQFKADKTDGTSIHFTVDAYGYQYARFLANNANDYRNTNNIPVLQINNAGKGLGLKIINSSSSTLEALNIDQDAVTSTHFRKIIKEDNTACCIWVSDGTTPHGALTGQAGDICLNGDSGNIYRCTGTTNWTAM